MDKKNILIGIIFFVVIIMVSLVIFLMTPQLQQGFLQSKFTSQDKSTFSREQIIKLIKINPEEVNRLVRQAKISPKYIKDIQIAKTLEGNIEIRHFDDFRNKKSREEYFIRQSDGKRIQIFNHGLQKMNPGTKLRLTGLYVKDIGLSVSQDNLTIIRPETIAISGTFKILVILASGRGSTPAAEEVDTLRNTLSTIFFGDDALSVKKFYENMSYGNLHVEGDVFASVVDVSSTAFEDLVAATDAMIDYGAYDAYYFVNINERCLEAYATIGKNQFTTGEGVHDFGAAVIHSGCIGEDFNDAFRHEFGHILALKHAGSWLCESSPLFDEPINPNCIDDYGDSVVMGEGRNFRLTSTHRDRLSNHTIIKNQIVVESGEYWLYSINNANTSLENQFQELQIQTEKGYYSLEYSSPNVYIRFVPTIVIEDFDAESDNAAEIILAKTLNLQEDLEFQDSARNISITLSERDVDKAKLRIAIP